MAQRLEVDLVSLLRAADTVTRLADQLAHLPARDAFARTADLLPGGLLACAARTEAQEWASTGEELHAGLDAHARGLREAVTTYRRTDLDAAAAVPAARLEG